MGNSEQTPAKDREAVFTVLALLGALFAPKVAVYLKPPKLRVVPVEYSRMLRHPRKDR